MGEGGKLGLEGEIPVESRALAQHQYPGSSRILCKPLGGDHPSFF